LRLWDLSTDWLDGDGRGTPELAAVLDRAPAEYHRGLAYADRVFSRTMGALDALSLPADTVFVVVGDHGEALGEHGTLSHGRLLYDEFVRVPLVVRAPGRLPAARVVEGSCGLVDVMPTLLALAGAPAEPSLDGRSLLPLAAGEERGHPVFASEDRNVITPTYAYMLRVVSVRTEAAKFLITYEPATQGILGTELYDLVADPRETTPLVGSDFGRFGEAFCRAAAKLRASVPGTPPNSACTLATR
jgi:arylsulfatase A-like enzyme